MKHTFTAPYYPRLNESVERMNRTLVQGLAKKSVENPNDWDIHLSAILLAYRTRPRNDLHTVQLERGECQVY